MYESWWIVSDEITWPFSYSVCLNYHRLHIQHYFQRHFGRVVGTYLWPSRCYCWLRCHRSPCRVASSKHLNADCLPYAVAWHDPSCHQYCRYHLLPFAVSHGQNCRLYFRRRQDPWTPDVHHRRSVHFCLPMTKYLVFRYCLQRCYPHPHHLIVSPFDGDDDDDDVIFLPALRHSPPRLSLDQSFSMPTNIFLFYSFSDYSVSPTTKYYQNTFYTLSLRSYGLLKEIVWANAILRCLCACLVWICHNRCVHLKTITFILVFCVV